MAAPVGRLRRKSKSASKPNIDAIFLAGLGPSSALGADEDLLDHGYRTVAPDLEQKHLAGGGAPVRQRPDVHEMGDQNNGLFRREAEQELPQLVGLPVGAGRVAEERVERGQILDRTQVEEAGRVVAAAPLAGEDPVDDHAGGSNRRPELSCLFPAAHIEIALGGAVVKRELRRITGPRGVGVAHDGDDAGLGQASEPRVGDCRRRWENESRYLRDCWKQACHQQVWEAMGVAEVRKEKSISGSGPRSSSQ